MFDPQSLTNFLAELALNNNKPWFDENRERYQTIRQELLIFCENIHHDLLQADPNLAHMNPKKCLFRINRDIRFSNNKSPYKTHFGAKFTNDGRKKGFAGYNVIFTAEHELLLMAGIHKLATPELNKIRDNIIETDDLRNIVQNSNFKQKFPLHQEWKLKTCPSGYDKNSPYLELLKLQSWWAIHRVPNQTWSNWSANQLHDYCVQNLAELAPFVKTLNKILYPEI